jgi:hypothetical protein
VQRLRKIKRSLGSLQKQEIKMIYYTIDSQGRQKRRRKIKSNVGPYEW